MDIRYIKSQEKKVQGKESEIRRKYGKEWKITELGGGNGNWLLTKNSDVVIDDISYRDFVLDYYHEDKLTESLVEQFRKALENGDIELPQES